MRERFNCIFGERRLIVADTEVSDASHREKTSGARRSPTSPQLLRTSWAACQRTHRHPGSHGYRFPGAEDQAAIELYPITGRKAIDAAKSAGLSAAAIPTLLVQSDNRPGLGHALARAIGDAGINIAFFMAQVLGRRYSGVIGFDSQADARKAAGLVRKATAVQKKVP